MSELGFFSYEIPRSFPLIVLLIVPQSTSSTIALIVNLKHVLFTNTQ